MKTVCINVTDDFILPEFFNKESPEYISSCLYFVSTLKEHFINNTVTEKEKLLNVTQNSIKETLDEVFKELKEVEFKNMTTEINNLKEQVNNAVSDADSYKTKLEFKTYELEVFKEQMKKDTEISVNTCTQKLKDELLESKQKLTDECVKNYNKGFSESKTRYEEELKHYKERTSTMDLLQKCLNETKDQLYKVEESKNSEISRLKEENYKLNTPMGKGDAGEFVVEETLRNSKFHVFDTSKSPYKEQGYLDKIVTEDGLFPSEGWKIAIEVKNKKNLVRSTDINAFLQKSEEGIKSKKFDASILLSIDDMIPGHHTNSTFLEFVNDENGIPIGPVAMFSPLLNTKKHDTRSSCHVSSPTCSHTESMSRISQDSYQQCL